MTVTCPHCQSSNVVAGLYLSDSQFRRAVEVRCWSCSKRFSPKASVPPVEPAVRRRAE